LAAADHKGLADALAAFQAEAPTFTKNKTATVKTKTGGEYSYKYADLGDILPAVRPLLAQHGLSWSAKPSQAETGELTLRYQLAHTSGEKDAGEMPLGVARDCRPQELGSAITYARRYALTAQLNLATEEDDDGQTAQHRDTTPASPFDEPYDKEALGKTVAAACVKLAGDRDRGIALFKEIAGECGGRMPQAAAIALITAAEADLSELPPVDPGAPEIE
jgi:ERF superfamily